MKTIMDEEFSPLAGTIESKDSVDFAQGQLQRTDRPLDLAIEGKGFFTLETPEGKLYTRNGSLQINILGQLTDLNGHLVSGRSGAITIPRTVSDSDIQINSEGVIKAGQIEIDKLKIVEFKNPSADLTLVGNSCYRAGLNADPEPVEKASVRQGHQEQSNVQAIGELTNLLGISRIFEANINFLKKQSQNSNAVIEVAKT
jgi:flagellar basal body rod protein FlgG